VEAPAPAADDAAEQAPDARHVVGSGEGDGALQRGLRASAGRDDEPVVGDRLPAVGDRDALVRRDLLEAAAPKEQPGALGQRGEGPASRDDAEGVGGRLGGERRPATPAPAMSTRAGDEPSCSMRVR
jgi:hypothetical protein